MKKLVLTAVTVIGFSASMLGQSQITIDNTQGAGNNHASSLGLFFNADGTVFTGATINAVLMGGNGSAGNVIASLTGANAMISGGGGVYLDSTFGTYDVPGVANGGTATLSLSAWRGAANSYASASTTDKFYAWNSGIAGYVDASAFTFTSPTGGGGAPPGPPKSALDGMPAMQLGAAIVPEPSTLALAGLGAAALLAYRRRNN
jgi:hypothetical protein